MGGRGVGIRWVFLDVWSRPWSATTGLGCDAIVSALGWASARVAG